MDDRQLQRLIRMAAEAEQLDHSAGRGAVNGVRTGTGASEHAVLERRDRSWWRAQGVWIGGALAAAASLALGLFVLMPQAPVAPHMPDRGLALGEAPQPPVEAAPALRAERDEGAGEAKLAAHDPGDEEAVLFAVYRGPSGACECVQVNQPEWSGEKRLADVSRHELLRAGLQDACMTVAPEVVVIGVAGKPGTVASSRQHAETIARRLGEQSLRGRDVASFAYAALPDLPAGTMVVAEKVSIGP